MKKGIVIGIIIAVLLAAAAFLVISYMQRDSSHVISLPSPVIDSGGSSLNDGIDRIDVNTETVKTVLGTLTRTENFSRTYTIKSFFDGKESEQTLNYWQSGEKIKLSISKDKTVRNILVLGSDLYIWYDGSSAVFKSKLSESSASKEIDMFSSLVTYEDIKDVPQENILDASYIEQSGQPCIYVEYKSGELGYTYQVYISVNSGLLYSMKKLDGDDTIFSMDSGTTDLSTPSDDIFTIP